MKTRELAGAAILAVSLLLPATTGPGAQISESSAVAAAYVAATALADGRLLFSGGTTAAGIVDEVVLISPTETTRAQLLTPRTGHQATLLADGHVAITGGSDARGPFDSIEIVEASGIITPGRTRLTRPVSMHAATLLADGRVLVTGGRQASGAPVAVVQALEVDHRPQTAELVDLVEPRAGHTATVLTSGEVLITGGEGRRGVLDSAELWSAPSASMLVGDHLDQPRAGHTATLLPSGDVLLAGGAGPGGIATATMERFDVKRRTFHRVPARLRTPRAHHVSVLLADGRVLFWGGVDATGRLLGGGELYDPRTQAIDPANDVGLALGGAPAQPVMVESHPRNHAVGVTRDLRIALRFSVPIAVTSVSAMTVQLDGPVGDVVAHTVGVEKGLLLFVQPTSRLTAGTRYTLSLDGLYSTAGLALPRTTVTFTTAGATGTALRRDGARDVTDPDEDERDLGRDARTGRRVSRWQDLPPLEAPPGVTAVSGQVLQLNGQPLAGVTFEIEGRRVMSDTTGRFLLGDLPDAGPEVLVIDGRTASRAGATYGEFEVSVNVVHGRTEVLGYTIWMPKIDTTNAVPIPSPTTSETVITSPRLRGLALHLPPGTIVRDRNGGVVTQLSITPVPMDRPPFPLPAGRTFAMYFTIQPGGASFESVDGVASPGASVVYPNVTGSNSGAVAEFWNYEPQGGVGWYPYGQGRVSDDAQRVEPEDGTRLYKITMFTFPTPQFGEPAFAGPTPTDRATDGDPVDLGTGLFVYTKTDLTVGDVLPIALERTYRPQDPTVWSFGIGTTHQYDMRLYSENGVQRISLVLPDGARVPFNLISGTSWFNAVLEHTESGSVFYKARLDVVGIIWRITRRDGTQYAFSWKGRLLSITDRFGNTVTLTRETLYWSGVGLGPWGKLQRITSPSGRWIDLMHDGQGRILEAADNGGRTVRYSYDTFGRLVKVVDAAGTVTEYTYDTSHRMLTVKDARGIVYLTNEYDGSGRLTKQTQADGTTYLFAYTVDGGGKVTQAEVTNPRGYVRRVTFSSTGYPLTDTRALGQAVAQTLTYTRQSGTNAVLTATDQLGRMTAFTYDSLGNVASVTRLSGTPDAVTTSFTYETAGTGSFSRLTSLTTPVATTTLTYDDPNRTITITDPLNHATMITHSTRGQVATIANALGQTTAFSYDSQGNLTGISDPVGHATTRAYDGYGRLIRQTDPKGHVTAFSYDALNQLRALADAQQGTTRFTYDANGNLLSLTDARGNTTSYTYNGMDRLVTRTDPLTRQEM